MDWFIKAFIRSSLIWFALGIALGVALAWQPQWVVYRSAHAHMNVAGFLTMLVFGVGYQLLPRLFGHPLASARMAIAHLFLANSGLAALVLGFLLSPTAPQPGRWLATVGGLLYALGAIFWIVNLWRTFDAADARNRARLAGGKTSLPTLGE